MAAPGSKAPARLAKELKTLNETPLEWAEISIVGDNIMLWRAVIEGPPDTPYEKGFFTIDLEMPSEYPFKHPKVKFVTKTYHPNILQKTGEICEEILKGIWSPQLKVGEVLTIIRQMLGEPNVSSPLEEDVAKLYTTDRTAYNKNAKEWTKKYATKAK